MAVAMMEGAIERFSRFLVSSRDAGTYAAFMLREIMQPGEVVDYIYDTLISRAHMRLCALFGVATGMIRKQPGEGSGVFTAGAGSLFPRRPAHRAQAHGLWTMWEKRRRTNSSPSSRPIFEG